MKCVLNHPHPLCVRCLTLCGTGDCECAGEPGVQPPQPVAPEPMPSREAPGFLEKVKNFAAAAAGHVAAGMPMASDEEIIRRHDICLACEHLVDNACAQCGCPISRVKGYVSKLSWADQECPLGKWGKVAGKTSIDP